ncbi:hypothetical protein Tco_1091781 [Tanacetum coccineum]|uniref:Uncharacterized protein n=1 Tax=Tanacetum coccineum TaxID=301880 RepID=A0ABQ5IA37_9ASTR
MALQLIVEGYLGSQLLGLYIEMHYHLLFKRLNTLRFSLPLRKRVVSDNSWSWIQVGGVRQLLLARQYLVGAIQAIAPRPRPRGVSIREAADRKEIDGDYRSAESRPSETETVSGDTKDSEEPQDSDDRASETAGTC